MKLPPNYHQSLKEPPNVVITTRLATLVLETAELIPVLLPSEEIPGYDDFLPISISLPHVFIQGSGFKHKAIVDYDDTRECIQI